MSLDSKARYAFFPGCTIPTKYPGFESATREVCRRMGIELVDLPFSCCPPASGLKQVHFDTWLALAARNICLAEDQQLDIVTICAGCVNTLKEANYILGHEPHRRRTVNRILNRNEGGFKGRIRVHHLLDVFHTEEMIRRLREEMRREVPVRVGCHYGCHFFRPPKMMYPDDLSPSESFVPVAMDHVLSHIGVEPMEYSRKFMCCGLPLGANVDPDASYEITREKLGYMAERDIEMISVGCPSCFEQFDMGQVHLRRLHKEKYNLPVLFFTQILGLAMEIEPGRLGLDSQRIKPKKLLKSKGLLD
jgi:heterodisulfide reductase subunit B